MLKLFIYTALLVISMPSFAAFEPQQALKQLPIGTNASLLIVNPATNKVIYQHQSNNLQPPASTQKLLTALAAKLYLGNDFRFSTNLETKGNNVILNFNGDPTLASSDIANLLRQLKQQGITTIKGNFYLNGGHFTGFEHAVGSPWDTLTQCYSAPSSSITVDHNCFNGALYSNMAFGAKTRLKIPSGQPVTAISDAIVVTKAQQKTQHCELSLQANDNNSYRVTGCTQPKLDPLMMRFAVQNTTLYSTAIIAKELELLGIRLDGKILRNDTISGKIIATHQSAPLSTLLYIMLKRSDNLFADNITKTIGAKYFNEAGNYANGVAAIKAILKQKANLDLSNTIMVDGSGLSRDNRLNTHDLMKVLTYINKHPKLGLINDLPVAGKSGTLKYRKSVLNAPLKGNIIAKTGTLFGTHNLAGIIKTKSGEPLLFVELVTNYYPTKAELKDSALSPINKFEKQYYTSLYNNY